MVRVGIDLYRPRSAGVAVGEQGPLDQGCDGAVAFAAR
jgi:hypothetical protein